MASCKSCGASIIWTTTEAGKKMPVDAQPASKGIVLLGNPADPQSRVVNVHLSHFATCPNANTHRKKPETP